MPIDKIIVPVKEESNNSDVEFASSDSLFNNVYISFKTKKGSRYEDKNFGSEFYKLEKNGKVNSETVAIAELYGEECTKWIIDTGRVKSIKVTASKNSITIGRIDLRWEIIKSDNRKVTYKLWYDVI